MFLVCVEISGYSNTLVAFPFDVSLHACLDTTRGRINHLQPDLIEIRFGPSKRILIITPPILMETEGVMDVMDIKVSENLVLKVTETAERITMRRPIQI